MTHGQETTLKIGRRMWSRRHDPSAVTIDCLWPIHMDHGNITWNLQVNAAGLCYPICDKWLCRKWFLIDATLLILLVSIRVKILLLLTVNKTLIILSIQNDSWPLLHKNNRYQLVWYLIIKIILFTIITWHTTKTDGCQLLRNLITNISIFTTQDCSQALTTCKCLSSFILWRCV